MEGSASDEVLGQFQRAESSFKNFDLPDAASTIATAADVTFVLGRDGVVVDVAVSVPELARAGFGRWVGRMFCETVTVESRTKVEALLADTLGGLRRWRQVNHPVCDAGDIPVEYCVIHVARDGRRIVAGRELSGIAALQQRLISTQQLMEREYARVRSAEARYRILFQIASEAVLVVDGTNERIVEANPAAAALFGGETSRLTSTATGTLLEPRERPKLQSMFAAVRATGGTDEIRTRSASGRPLGLSASLFRQGTKSFFLVRATRSEPAADSAPGHSVHLAEIIDSLPDGFVVCDERRNVLGANAAFVELTQLASVEQLRGEPLSRWIGRTGLDVDLLFNALAQQQMVRRFSTVARGEHGATEEVEIAAVAVVDAPGSDNCYGLAIRIVRPHSFSVAGSLERSVTQLTELVGRVPLKDLVRETTDLIERLCIEAALRLTDDNRASAAELLGLSRQSLYIKMRRYDIISSDPDVRN